MPELRKSGIDVLGDIPPGAHFCQFYETKQDLLDTLVPYFKTGLENNEFCLWVIQNSELITVEEAKGALKKIVPGFDRYFLNGNIEIVNGLDWYLEENHFSSEKVTAAWKTKLKQALTLGYDGMRVSGDTFWLNEKIWKDFIDYEKQVNDSFIDLPMTLLCTYPLSKSGASDILDVVHAHHFAIARRQGKWEVIESPKLIQAKAEIKKLNEELEQKVVERTRQLEKANNELRNEITERRSAEEELKKEKEILAKIFDNIPVMIGFVGDDGGVKLVNPEWERTMGWTLKELQEQNVDIFADAYPDISYRQEVLDFVAASTGEWMDLKIKVRDGRVINVACAIVQLSDGTKVAIAQDITVRKQAEDALRKNEDKIRFIIDTIPIMAWTSLPDGTVDFANQRWLDYAGKGAIEDPNRLIHPEDFPAVTEKWLVNKAAGEAYEGELRMRRIDGEYRWFLVRTAPLYDEQRNIVKWYGVSIDIEDSKRAEDELRLAYQRLSYHFENTPLAVIELDKDLFIKRWSKRAEAIFGWKESEALGKNVYDADFPIIYKEDMPAVDTINEQLIKGVVNRNLSLNRNYTKDGKVIYSEWYNSVLRDEQGNVITILSLVHNVTEKKIAEEQIRQSEAHLAEAQRLAKLGSWDFDIKTDRLTWSEELYNVFGTDKRTFRETHGSFLRLVDEEDRELALQTSRHTQQTGEPFTIEYHITTPKGEKRIIQEHGYGQTDDNGKVVHLFGTAQDITERKKTEETLRQSYEEIRRLTEHLQKIREEERTSIAREIHDELGQQLTAIKMDVAWIDKKTSEETTDIKRKLKNIIQLLDGSNQSIRRILSELRPRILDDHGWMEAIEWLAMQFSENTGIPVKFTTPEKEIKVAEQIATSIFRVCQEAFTNITRYALANNVSVSINIIEETIILIIEDDGTGFDTGSLQNKKSFGILGMKERVLSLGGQFELTSSPGNGTKITIRMPYK